MLLQVPRKHLEWHPGTNPGVGIHVPTGSKSSHSVATFHGNFVGIHERCVTTTDIIRPVMYQPKRTHGCSRYGLLDTKQVSQFKGSLA